MVPTMTNQLPSPAGIVAANLDMLMKDRKWKAPQLAHNSGVSVREVYHVIKGERFCRTDTLEKLALAFRLRSWELLVPHTSVETLKSGEVGQIVHDFLNTGPEGRQHIKVVASREVALFRG